MGCICEHEFMIADNKEAEYSLTEYDLAAKYGLTLRKNLKENIYEIVTIKKPREVKHRSKDIHEIARLINEIEGGEYTTVECGTLCPERRNKYRFAHCCICNIMLTDIKFMDGEPEKTAYCKHHGSERDPEVTLISEVD